MGTPSRPGAPVVPYPRDGELRRSDRLTARLPTVVRGVNATGVRFKHTTVLENISRGGLYLTLPEAVDTGTTLFLVVRFAYRDDVAAARVALRGRVIRIEPQPSGGRGVAVAFTHHHFL